MKTIKYILLFGGIALVASFLFSLGRMEHFFSIFIISSIFSFSIGTISHYLFVIYKKMNFPKLLIGYITTAIISTLIGTEFSLFVIIKILKIKFFSTSFTHSTLTIINLIIGLTIFLFIYIKYKINYANMEAERLKRLNTEAQLKVLSAKLNPHFLFNTLNILPQLAYESPESVEKIVINLSDIYRKILTLTDKPLITVEEELELIEKYLEIEKYRMSERCQFEIVAPENVKKEKILPLTIEVLVENSIIHGISPKKNGGTIKININRNENKLEIEVTDTGIGFEPDKITKQFGLSGLKERLNYFYGEDATLKIVSSKNGGTKIKMEVPIVN